MRLLNEQIKALLEEKDMIAALSNVSALIKENDEGLNWAGFYFVRHNELVLGPFQGRLACTHIPFDKGVCGLTYRSKQTQKIDDVLSFPGHIACDSASRSELCVPVLVNGACVMEIDLDSDVKNHFTDEDSEGMEEAAQLIAEAFINHGWNLD